MVLHENLIIVQKTFLYRGKDDDDNRTLYMSEPALAVVTTITLSFLPFANDMLNAVE